MNVLRIKPLALFYRKFAELTKAGIPVLEALDLLAQQSGQGLMANVCLQMKQYVAGGMPLGEAFAQFPSVFPEWQVTMIKYSETSGKLSAGLERLVAYLEKELATVQSLLVGLAYPALLLHLAIFMLPLARAVTCGAGGYVWEVLKILVPLYGIPAVLYALARGLNQSQAKIQLDQAALMIPLFGPIVKKFSLAHFMRAMECLLSSGVAVLAAWKMAAEACGNSFIRKEVLKGIPLIENGQPLSAAFREAGVFTAEMVGMIAVAERSGGFGQTLATIASYTEKENETAVAMIARTLPVVIYVLVALFIGMRVLSFYQGYFDRMLSF